MIKNKKGQVDARNALGVWSFFKWVVDLLIIVGSGGLFAHMPSVDGSVIVLAFVLWLWTFFKFVVDTPLVLIWLWGKIKHRTRKKKKKR